MRTITTKPFFEFLFLFAILLMICGCSEKNDTFSSENGYDISANTSELYTAKDYTYSNDESTSTEEEYSTDNYSSYKASSIPPSKQKKYNYSSKIIVSSPTYSTPKYSYPEITSDTYKPDSNDIYSSESNSLYAKYINDTDAVNTKYISDTESIMEKRSYLENQLASLRKEYNNKYNNLNSQLNSMRSKREIALANALAQSGGHENSYYKTLKKQYDDNISNLEKQIASLRSSYSPRISAIEKELDNIPKECEACENAKNEALKKLKEKYDSDLKILKEKYGQK